MRVHFVPRSDSSACKRIRRGTLVTPAEASWIIKCHATDLTSRFLQEANATIAPLLFCKRESPWPLGNRAIIRRADYKQAADTGGTWSLPWSGIERLNRRKRIVHLCHQGPPAPGAVSSTEDIAPRRPSHCDSNRCEDKHHSNGRGRQEKAAHPPPRPTPNRQGH